MIYLIYTEGDINHMNMAMINKGTTIFFELVVYLILALCLFVIVDSILWGFYYVSFAAVIFLGYLAFMVLYFRAKAKKSKYMKYFITAHICLALLVLVVFISMFSPLRPYFVAEHFSYYSIPANYIFITGLNRMSFVDKQLNKDFHEIINERMTEEEKAIAVYDYMIINFRYSRNVNSLYDVLTTKKANCVGMTMIAQDLFKKAGIKSYHVSGLGNKEDHAWNMIKLNGKYYHIDFTMVADDRYVSRTGDNYTIIPDVYKVYNMSDTIAEIHHDWNYKDYPACNSMYYDDLINRLKVNKDLAAQGILQKLYSVPNDIYIKAE